MDLIKEIRAVRNVIDGYAKKHAAEGHVEKAKRNESLALALGMVCAQLGEVDEALAGILPDGTTVARVRHLAKLYADASDEHHDGAVAIYERLRASSIRGRPLRIDGNVREMGEDVVSFIDAAEKAVGDNAHLLAMAVRSNTEMSAQVATLTAERDSALRRIDEALATLGYCHERLDEFTYSELIVSLDDHSCDAEGNEVRSRLLDENVALRADIERLTKERAFGLRVEGDLRQDLATARADNARHLETVRALREAGVDAIRDAHNRGIHDGHPMSGRSEGTADIVKEFLDASKEG